MARKPGSAWAGGRTRWPSSPAGDFPPATNTEARMIGRPQHHCTDGGRTVAGFTSEKNDCTVRAVAVGCGVPYDVAHDELARRGRKNGRGVQFYSLWKNDPIFCGHQLVPVFDTYASKGARICLCTAIRKF